MNPFESIMPRNGHPEFRAILTLAAALFAAFPARSATEPSLAAREEQKYRETLKLATAAFVFIGGGSGVLISPDGYVLSNHHVVGSSKRWRVRVGDKNYEAVVVGNDPHGDIALLRIRNATPMAHVQLAEADDLTIGKPVLAVGNPFATAELFGEPSLTRGIISAVHVFSGTYTDAIQTDAPINPGNSGGPLLTLDGRLLGINGKIETRFGQRANTGIGLAIPVTQIARFLPHLKAANGSNVFHGFIRGLVGAGEDDDGRMDGAVIKEVRPGSPAEKLGLKAGDRIVNVNEHRLLNYHRFLGVLGTYPAETPVQLTYLRDAATKTLRVVLDPFIPGSLGLKFAASRNLAQPAVIDQVYPGQAAERAGLKPGDTIVKYEDKPVNSLMELMWHQTGKELQAGDEVTVTVERKVGRIKEEQEIKVVLSSAYDVPQERRPRSRR